MIEREGDSGGQHDFAEATLQAWGDGTDPAEVPNPVRRAYPELSGPLGLRTLSGGLLHRSFHARSASGDFVLQRVSDVFAPEIHDNIAAVTRHLAAKGQETFELRRANDGRLFADAGTDGRWRLLSYIEGGSLERLDSRAQARSAGALVGRFHAALDDFEVPLAPLGIPFRETDRYLEGLRAARARHPDHRLAAQVESIAAQVLSAFEDLGPAPPAPDRVIHGDLKLANLLFETSGPLAGERAKALIDLDTLMRAPLHCEWGDAWRSWCNPSREDAAEVSFDLDLYAGSLEGFVEGFGGLIDPVEARSLETATERITLELVARFATDMLEESYFAWDATRFESAGEHHLARAHNQLALFERVSACRSDRAAILAGVTDSESRHGAEA